MCSDAPSTHSSFSPCHGTPSILKEDGDFERYCSLLSNNKTTLRPDEYSLLAKATILCSVHRSIQSSIDMSICTPMPPFISCSACLGSSRPAKSVKSRIASAMCCSQVHNMVSPSLTTAVPGEIPSLGRPMRRTRVEGVQLWLVLKDAPTFPMVCVLRDRCDCTAPKSNYDCGGGFLVCMSHFSHTTFSLCRLKAAAEAALSWQPLTHV